MNEFLSLKAFSFLSLLAFGFTHAPRLKVLLQVEGDDDAGAEGEEGTIEELERKYASMHGAPDGEGLHERGAAAGDDGDEEEEEEDDELAAWDRQMVEAAAATSSSAQPSAGSGSVPAANDGSNGLVYSGRNLPVVLQAEPDDDNKHGSDDEEGEEQEEEEEEEDAVNVVAITALPAGRGGATVQDKAESEEEAPPVPARKSVRVRSSLLCFFLKKHPTRPAAPTSPFVNCNDVVCMMADACFASRGALRCPGMTNGNRGLYLLLLLHTTNVHRRHQREASRKDMRHTVVALHLDRSYVNAIIILGISRLHHFVVVIVVVVVFSFLLFLVLVGADDDREGNV